MRCRESPTICAALTVTKMQVEIHQSKVSISLPSEPRSEQKREDSFLVFVCSRVCIVLKYLPLLTVLSRTQISNTCWHLLTVCRQSAAVTLRTLWWPPIRIMVISINPTQPYYMVRGVYGPILPAETKKSLRIGSLSVYSATLRRINLETIKLFWIDTKFPFYSSAKG